MTDTEHGAQTLAGRVARPRPLVLWAVLAFIFVGCHYLFYFRWSFYEGGDFAANALQIRNAKGLAEIYGNYSRFGFHHPGPAFFYVYAAGERVFFDLLKVVPTPFAAHSLAGVLLQLGFFTWAISIVAKHIKRPLIVPLLLLFAAFYFGTVNHFLENSAFQSIWPPHVLLMPFLCFLVACASVAAGRIQELLPLVLAGCFLVHGHVAQPLFVGPLSVLAYVMWWRTTRAAPASRPGVACVHALAGGIIALFVLPLAIDALKGTQSNLRLIITHFSTHAGEQKTFAQSALYIVTFLCHVVDPEKFCDQIGARSFDFLAARWYLLAMWAVGALLTAALLRRTVRAKSLGDPPFTRCLALFLAAACALTLVWGKLQTGPLFEFNSHFNFAILFLVFILLAIAIASLPALKSAEMLSVAVFAASLPLTYYASRNFSSRPDFASQPPFTVELNDQIRTAALQDRQSSRTKFLLYDDWGEAARVALALSRLHYPFRVPAGGEVIFGRGRGIAKPQALNNPKLAIWKVAHASTGPDWLRTDIKAVAPNGGEILFATSTANVREFVSTGWDLSNGPQHSWTIAKEAVLRFTPLSATSDVEIACDVAPSNEYQPMLVTFNGGHASVAFQIREPTTVVLRVPAAIWNESPVGILHFAFPGAVSQPADEITGEIRELGCAFRAITFRYAP